MKKLLCFCCGLLVATAGARATALFSDSFTYPDGNLVGNDGWTQTSTTTTAPIQVSSDQAVIGPTGQDVYNATLSGGGASPITIANGSSLYLGLDINVSIAQATGDYFLHFTPTAGNTGTLSDRLYVKSSGSGYVLGWAASSSGVAYGTTVLSLGTTYHVVTAYNVFGGGGTATGAIYVDPTSGTLGVDTPYFSGGFGGGTENDIIAAVNFRQGTAANAPTVTADNLVVSQTWSDMVTSVPEPTTLSLLGGFGLLAWFVGRRK